MKKVVFGSLLSLFVFGSGSAATTDVDRADFYPLFKETSANFSGAKNFVRSPTNGPTCDLIPLQQELELLQLSPGIRTNQELKEAVVIRYGEAFWDEITDKHIVLKHPWGAVDGVTVSWVTDSLFASKARPFEYHYMIFDDPASTEEMLKDIIASAVKGGYTKKVVVWSQSYMNAVLDEVDKWPLDRIIHEIAHNESGLGLSLGLIERWGKKLHQSLNSGNMFQIGSSGVKSDSVFAITAHYKGEGDVLHNLTNDELIPLSDVVDEMKNMKVPEDARIRLQTCHSACKNESLPYPTRDALQQAYLKGDLKARVMTEKGDQSLLAKLKQELEKQWPEFSGDLEGYIGELGIEVHERVLHPDGTIRPGLLVRVWSKEGVVHLEQNSMRVVWSLRKPSNGKVFRQWKWNGDGIPGDVYGSGDGSLFRLKTFSYGTFPKFSDNDYWEWIGPKAWSPSGKGKKGEIFARENPVTGVTEYFMVKGDAVHPLPPGQNSNDDWEYLGTPESLFEKQETTL